MKRSFVSIIIALRFFVFSEGNILAQDLPSRSFFLELHTAVQGSFGPSTSQAEIAGGIDSISFDKKKHLSPGFKSSFATEIVGGFSRKKFQFQSTLGYYKQDIGLVEKLSKEESPFVMADLFSIKASALLQLSNSEKRGANGLYTGLFIGSVFPISNKIDDQIKINYAVKAIRPSAEYYWGIDYSYSIALGKKGWYAITGASVTMPGLLGGIGKIELQNNSSYSIIRDKIQMYSIRGSIGIGFRLQNREERKK